MYLNSKLIFKQIVSGLLKYIYKYIYIYILSTVLVLKKGITKTLNRF